MGIDGVSPQDESGASRTPAVSIIMPFFNVERFIAPAIDSALAQSFQDWELLVIDDGSTDRSTEIARGYEERFPGQIRYFEHENHANRGASAARNLGGRHARGDFIAYLDADDIWLPHKLERQVELLAAHPEAGMVVGATKYWSSWTGRVADAELDKVVMVGVPAEKLYRPFELLDELYPLGRGVAPSMNTVMLRAEVLENIGGWEEGFRIAYTDQAFLVKLYLHTPVFVAGEVWDLYRQRPESSSQSALAGDGYRTIRRQFLSWFRDYLQDQGMVETEAWARVDRALQPRQRRGA